MDFRYLLNSKLPNVLQALPEDFTILAMALESTNSGVVISDCRQPDNPIIFCNHAFENLTGYSREEIIGRNCRILQAEDRGQEQRKLLAQSINSGEPITVELKNYRKNGTLFWNELSIAPVRSIEGEVTHFIGIQTDITQKRVLETQLLDQISFLNDRLEQQDKYIKAVDQVLHSIMEAARESLLILDRRLNITKVNANFFEIFNQSEADVIGFPFTLIQQGKWNNQELVALMNGALERNEGFSDFILSFPGESGSCKEVTVSGSKVLSKGLADDYILIKIRCRNPFEQHQDSSIQL